MSKYEQFFEIHSRMNGKKKIAIVRSDCLNSFITTLIEDNEVSLEMKSWICVSLSGGMRINESLAIRTADFIQDNEHLYVEIDVLKKRKKERRLVKIHPEAKSTVQLWLSTVIGKPFKFSERTALRRIKAIIGIDEVVTHSLRHSMVSFLLFSCGMTHIKCSKLLKIGLDSLEYYSKANPKRLWNEVY